MKKYIIILIFLSFLNLNSQDDKEIIKRIFDNSMSKSKSYELLDHLSNEIGGRLSGSLNAERAVKWGKNELSKRGFDRVWLQEIMVPKWVSCLLYTSPSPRDVEESRMPSSA